MDDFLEAAFESTNREERAKRKQASRQDRSKYKKTDQTQRRRLEKEDKEKRTPKKNLLKGRVLAIFPEGVVVETEGVSYTCTLRGALKKELTRAKNLITVGDFVFFEKEGSIVEIEERRSVLSRQEHFQRRQKQLIAANIDQVLITVSVKNPPLKPFLVDRYIIAAFKGGMTPVIVVNKMDLLETDSPEDSLFQVFYNIYTRLTISVIPVSVKTGKGIALLKKKMANKASVFAGQSGVGKSSLINHVAGLTLPTQEVIERSGKGMHTTTHAQLLPLAFGGWCIDTPGIRSFGIWDLTKYDLEVYFPEITEAGRACKFPDCTHSHEPGCAIEEALEAGTLSLLRLESYQKLLEEIRSV